MVYNIFTSGYVWVWINSSKEGTSTLLWFISKSSLSPQLNAFTADPTCTQQRMQPHRFAQVWGILSTFEQVREIKEEPVVISTAYHLQVGQLKQWVWRIRVSLSNIDLWRPSNSTYVPACTIDSKDVSGTQWTPASQDHTLSLMVDTSAGNRGPGSNSSSLHNILKVMGYCFCFLWLFWCFYNVLGFFGAERSVQFVQSENAKKPND